jgi:hypothetical protein
MTNQQFIAKPSVLVRDEFASVSAFVAAFKERDMLKVQSIFYKDLYQRMDAYSQKLAKQLINRISSPNQTHPELQQILDDKEIDEQERRKELLFLIQMFIFEIFRQTNV